MNAKKIMGAVLVALLAAALFTGAVAAADKGTVFINQKEVSDLAGSPYTGTWTYGAATVNVDASGNVTAGANFVPGTYKKGDHSMYVTYPTATITGIAGTGAAAYNFIGATLYEGETTVSINAVSPAGLTPEKYVITYSNGTSIEYDYTTGINNIVLGFDEGTYEVAVKYDVNDFVEGTLVNLLTTASVSFKVAGADDATISASATEMIKGEDFKITVTGKPGVTYAVNATQFAFNVTPNQPGISIASNADNATLVMPNTGKVTFTISANTTIAEKEQTIQLKWYNTSSTNADKFENVKKAKLTIKFQKGAISAKADAASYFVGDIVTITGTTTAGKIVKIDIKGTNFAVENIQNSALEEAIEYKGDAPETFTIKLNTSSIKDNQKMLDVGTYSITLNTTSGVTAVVPVALKQPFISIVEAPEVVVKDTDAEFIINAEATDKIAYYIFGTNYFDYAEVETHVEDEEGEDIENQFLVELTDDVTDTMDAGQYFAVFQHPMYDGILNIYADDATGTQWPVYLRGTTPELFNVKDRQTANAAQALCDALDTQNIDDMYVKYSFFVVGEDESFVISEIPTQVVKGDKIVISGVDTANADETVTVEMISTAFAAVPKEEVNSAAFIVATAVVAEDGTWEITLDTSDLNVDEYSLSVVIKDATKKNVKVNVVEGEPTVDPTEQPTTVPTEQPTEQPTEPTSPGFGALAALAGLGAVAVLLLRRE